MTAGANAGQESFIAIPADVRELLDGPDYVHLSTLRRDDTDCGAC